MKINRLEFSIDIQAKPSMIWEALWNEASYRKWVGVFFEGSFAISDNWKEGSTVLFLAPDQSGIYSLVEEHIPNKVMRFKHIGNVKEGIKLPLDDESKAWTGSSESYTLVEKADHVTLKVDIDVLDEHTEFMNQTFPKALDIIKANAICNS